MVPIKVKMANIVLVKCKCDYEVVSKEKFIILY